MLPHAPHDFVCSLQCIMYRFSKHLCTPPLTRAFAPRLPATTPMYDMLRLFQTGRSHIAVLTQPPPGELQRLMALDQSQVGGGEGLLA